MHLQLRPGANPCSAAPAMLMIEISTCRLQDRHLLMEDFRPSKGAALKERCPEVRSLAGVFDGHKRHEPAETAAKRLPELLAK